MVNYPKWLANVASVLKKEGKVRMCVDLRDLNKASPKDDFPQPTMIFWLIIWWDMHCYHS